MTAGNQIASIPSPTTGIDLPEIYADQHHVAEFLKVSHRQVDHLDKAGRIPAPIRLGRLKRWNRSELIAWANAGAPGRDEWDELKTRLRPSQTVPQSHVESC